MLRKKFRRLQDDVYLLKRTRQHLISCQATFKSKRQQLVNGLVGASNDLLSACQTALSRSEKRLEKIRKKSEKKVDEVLDIQKLTKQAIKLFRSVNSAARQRDTQNTCEVNEVALDAVEKLATAEMLDLESHCSEFRKYWLAPGLKNISARLAELSLLVVHEPPAAANWAQLNLQANSGNQTSFVLKDAPEPKPSDRIKQDVGTSKQTAKNTTMPIQLQQEEKQKQGKQYQRDLQQHLDITDLDGDTNCTSPRVTIRSSRSGQLNAFSSLTSETEYRRSKNRLRLPTNRIEAGLDLTPTSTPPMG
ncbi:hypothetical protein SprV_0200962300 [Sparganum proliferum]